MPEKLKYLWQKAGEQWETIESLQSEAEEGTPLLSKASEGSRYGEWINKIIKGSILGMSPSPALVYALVVYEELNHRFGKGIAISAATLTGTGSFALPSREAVCYIVKNTKLSTAESGRSRYGTKKNTEGTFRNILAWISVSSAVKPSILLYFGRQPTHGNDGHFFTSCQTAVLSIINAKSNKDGKVMSITVYEL